MQFVDVSVYLNEYKHIHCIRKYQFTSHNTECLLVLTVVFVLYSCSGHLIPYTEEFICTVVLGYDVVPRLGLVEAIQLRIDVLHALRYCNLPKVIIEYSIVKFSSLFLLTQNLNLRTHLKLEYNIKSLNYIQKNFRF